MGWCNDIPNPNAWFEKVLSAGPEHDFVCCKSTIQWQLPPCDGATYVGFWPGGLWRNNEYLRVFQRYSTKIGWIDLEKVWWAGYCDNYSGLLFLMKAWLFFSVALLVYGFAFESTFAKDKSPTLATLGAALVAGSLMWVVWRINWLLCLLSFFHSVVSVWLFDLIFFQQTDNW